LAPAAVDVMASVVIEPSGAGSVVMFEVTVALLTLHPPPPS
jgi:hypothetical protein